LEITVRGVALALLLSLFAACPVAAQSGNWPDHPIRLVVPFPPGSSSDIVARIVAQGLSGKLGQPVVVENRPGASTALGGEYVAHSPPDGYTLGLVNTSSTITQSLNPAQSFDVVKDFAPISMLGASPFVLASYPGVPVQTTQELIALAKAEPGKHTFAEAGQATLANLAGVLFTKLADVQITAVAYRGTEQEVPDLIAGRVDTAFVTIPPTLSLIQQGRVRALGVTGANRSPALPDVPTIAEAGLSGYEAVLWQAINAPAGTPTPIVTKVNAAINALLAEPDTIAAMNKVGVEVQASTPQQLGERVAADLKKWHDVIAAAGIKPE
jgi:tripartite-type tricarboxylate transporter receptor subunit TctC